MAPASPSSATTLCRAAWRVRQLQRKPPRLNANRSLNTTTATTTTTSFSNNRPRPHSSPHSTVLIPRKPPCALHCRTYHSYDHPAPDTPFSGPERVILAAAYTHIPEHGFSHESLTLGARDAGFLDISTNIVPDGVFSLVQWHMVAQREALAGRAQELLRKGEEMGVGRKVEVLIWERLMGNTKVIQRWQEALAIMAQPSYVPESLKELAKLSDDIWFLAGDTAVDPSWYTKRASLSAVYASTELFMTTDQSEGFVETRKFLRRRLDEVQGLGSTLKSVGEWVGFTASAGLNVLRSKGVRI